MAEPTADMRAALAEALEESQFPTSDGDAAASWDEWDEDDGAPAPKVETASADEDEPSTDEAPESPAEPETDEAQAELPDEYWGVPLEGIPDDAKKVILDHFAQQDSTIQKLQARLAKEPEAPTDVPADDLATEDITDEALAIALGYDPEGYEQLPFDRVQILRYAIEEEIASPYETYFKLSAPVKREVEQTVAEARRQAAKKAEAGGLHPRSSAGTASAIDPKTTSLKDAVAIAMKESEKETGLSFKNIFGSKKFKAE
jgi:hypothetical protein